MPEKVRKWCEELFGKRTERRKYRHNKKTTNRRDRTRDQQTNTEPLSQEATALGPFLSSEFVSVGVACVV